MTPRLEALLAELQSAQPPDLSIQRSAGHAEVKVGSDPIASIDERQEKLVVYAPANVRADILAKYPRARPDPAGVSFDLRHDDDAAAGFELVRRRATVERRGWQYRERSP